MSGVQELARMIQTVIEDQDLAVIPTNEEMDEDLRTEFNVEDVGGEVFRVIIVRED